ncbi:MAG: plasmid pRiA4b ORF-3 family protein [Balneolaceae bacterium]
MSTKIYQLHLELQGTKPKIWRRMLVSSDVLLSDLHKIIQTTMGWTNSHLHQFIKDREFYEPPAPEDEIWDSHGNDYTGIKLYDFLLQENDKIVYEYDFGDSWNHVIKLEKILPADKNSILPKCIGGALASPPEDCGGVWGFEEMKKALKNPKHPEHDMYMEWLGEGFDPNAFDMEAVNEMLQDEDYGVIVW